jgi:hypothetical protein
MDKNARRAYWLLEASKRQQILFRKMKGGRVKKKDAK